MKSTRDIGNKIRTVRNIEQICRAMKTVSSIRLRRAEQRLYRARPYNQKLAEMVGYVAALTKDHPFLQPRPVKQACLILVTSDRGLCGGYNATAARAALAAGSPTDLLAVAIGRKGLVQLRRHGYRIVDELTATAGEPQVAAVQALAERTGERYLAGEIDRLQIVYTEFLGGTRGEVKTKLLLPVEPALAAAPEIIFEPAPAAMLPGLMRRYLQQKILGAVIESAASEHGARVAAMTAATDNAEDMIQQLTREYNKARQAAITKELIEIVSASGAA